MSRAENFRPLKFLEDFSDPLNLPPKNSDPIKAAQSGYTAEKMTGTIDIYVIQYLIEMVINSFNKISFIKLSRRNSRRKTQFKVI